MPPHDLDKRRPKPTTDSQAIPGVGALLARASVPKICLSIAERVSILVTTLLAAAATLNGWLAAIGPVLN